MTETNGQAPAAAEPEAIWRGRVNLLLLPNGDYALMTKADGDEEWQQMPIPGMIVKLAAAQGAGGIFGRLKAAMTGG